VSRFFADTDTMPSALIENITPISTSPDLPDIDATTIPDTFAVGDNLLGVGAGVEAPDLIRFPALTSLGEPSLAPAFGRSLLAVVSVERGADKSVTADFDTAFDSDGNLIFFFANGVPADVTFGGIPEPATSSLLLLAACGAVCVRRRTAP
ncbi:MAG: PEP-CTERM sorting domain-containing protein, partial [Planctomycetota bacterium]